jgi:hypothetical protein
MTANADLLVNRKTLSETRIVEAPLAALADGEALLRVDGFSLTANNVTYAALGDMLKYWDFFPAPGGSDGFGRVPVWGFATVMESRADGVAPGQRVYGYLPMSNTFKLTPGPAKHGAFSETAQHRAGLAPIYNRYILNDTDPYYTKDTEALQMLYRPLHGTSFLIDDFLAENDFFGARQVVFSSASAKTAFAAAQIVKARNTVKVVGLTSPGNMEFVRGLGFYDEVLDYAALATMDAATPTVFVDIAGDSGVRAAIHNHFQNALTYSCAVGATHWMQGGGGGDLPGPRPQMFFAPGIIQKRVAELGPAVFQERAVTAWRAFLPTAKAVTNVVEGRTLEDAARAFTSLVTGKSDAKSGHVIRLG